MKDFHKVEQVLAYLEEIQSLEGRIALLKEQNSTLLGEFEAANEGATKFEHQGRFYGVRARDGKRFLVSSDAPLGRKKTSP